MSLVPENSEVVIVHLSQFPTGVTDGDQVFLFETNANGFLSAEVLKADIKNQQVFLRVDFDTLVPADHEGEEELQDFELWSNRAVSPEDAKRMLSNVVAIESLI